MIFLILLNAVLLIMLAFLHIFWAMGGNFGMNAVLPSLSPEHSPKHPSTFAKAAVAAVLMLFAFIIMCNSGIIDPYIERRYIQYITIAIGILFLGRAIGDFKFVGFFKKIQSTLFAKNDTRYYSPLCVLIGLNCILMVLIE